MLYKSEHTFTEMNFTEINFGEIDFSVLHNPSRLYLCP